MAFTNLPLVDAVVEQANLLEKLFRGKLEPELAYAAVADRQPVKARGGETLTISRPALFPLNASGAILNPATRNNLDNGLTPQVFGYEQVSLAIQEWATSSDVSLEQEQVLVASLVVETLENLAQNAGATFDQNVAIIAHTAYDSGNTFATAAGSGATVTVDNINGFDTAYSTVANSSPGLPAATSSTNSMKVYVYDKTTGALKDTLTLQTAVADPANVSSAIQNGTVYGRSGTLTFSANPGTSIAQGDNIVGVDGSYILRPNGKASRFTLASTDVLTLQLLANSAAKLRARGVRPLRNGLYAAIVDPLILPQLIADTAWQRATATQLEHAAYFKNGIPLPMYGIEVITSTMVPAYTLPSAGTAGGVGFERHAVVVGAGAFIKAPYEGMAAAVAAVSGNPRSLHRIHAMSNDIYLVLRAPMDRVADWMSMTWKFQGAFQAMTDVTSTPAQIPTTDYSRFKRALVIGVYSAF
jgi:hypothetical protein